MKKLVFPIIVVLLCCCIVGVILADYYRESPEVVTASLVGRQQCASCHQPQADAFHGSHHDKAMAIATDESVLADFNDQTLEHFGVTSRMFRDGERFMINTEGPDGQMHDYEVKYTFGVEPLQQYMVEIQRPADAAENEIGKVQVLRVSWDTAQKKWFYLTPPDVFEKIESTDPLHWTGITQNWNTTCATCHSTGYHKNFDVATNSYHTTFSEIDVSCEACHGPASYHVELAERTSLFWDRKHGYGLTKLKTESNLAQINTCAPCHSRRAEVKEGFTPGCNFDEYFVLQTIDEPIYFVDGQIRDEDYVIGSFTQSKMFHNGVKCSDCHDMHSTKLIHSGNQVCTSCHQHSAGKYDTPNHHHHAVGTPGAQCVNCHMPHTTYMMVDDRRDHSFRVPDPALSIATGTPNACTGCHLDTAKLAGHKSKIPLLQYKDWVEAQKRGDEVVAAELSRVNERMLLAIESWYTDDSKERTTYYRDLAKGLSEAYENGKQAKRAQADLLTLAKDDRTPKLIRASALAAINHPDILVKAESTAVDLLRDDDLTLVSSSLALLDRRLRFALNDPRASREETAYIVPPIVAPIAKQLDHSTSRIRIQAARILFNLPPQMLRALTDGRQQSSLEDALMESQVSLMLNNDQAMPHMIMANFHEKIRDFSQAEKNYRNAIKIEPYVSGARGNLAVLLEAKRRTVKNEAERQQLAQEIKALRLAENKLLAVDVERAKDLPNTHALHFNYALSCYSQQDYEKAKKHIKIAFEQQPQSQQYLYAMVYVSEKLDEYEEANRYVDLLLKIAPGNRDYQEAKRRILLKLKKE